jgi:cbb3-type cytochrome oxidase subunit 3
MTGDASALLPTLGLLIVLGAFIGVVAWLLRPGAAQAARRHAELPFRTDPPRGGEGGER